MENLFSVTGPVKRMKRRAIDWEEILANHIADKGLIEDIKNSQKSTVKQAKKFNWKVVKRHEGIFH